MPASGCRWPATPRCGSAGPPGGWSEAGTEAEVVAAVRAADAAGEPLLVLGGGSNLVIADEGFPGTVVRVATSGVRASAHGRGAGRQGLSC